MLEFVDYIATKQLMADMLQSLPGGTSDLYALSTTQITVAIKSLVDRAVAAGEIELGMEPLDMLRALSGVAHANAESARRMVVDILCWFEEVRLGSSACPPRPPGISFSLGLPSCRRRLLRSLRGQLRHARANPPAGLDCCC